jgi:hypothetical protein
MAFVERNDEVQAFAPDGPNHAFTKSIRSGSSDRSLDCANTKILHRGIDGCGENGIAVIVVRKKYDPSLSGLLFQAIIVMQTAENRFRCDSITDRQLVPMDRIRSAGLDRLRNSWS